MRISDWSSDVCSSDLLLVSVVIPFHTQRETNGYLRRALESIERQTIDGVQVIAVRDEERQGAAATRHAGLMLVDTPWVAFLDSDVEMEPGHLEKCLETAEVTDRESTRLNSSHKCAQRMPPSA